MYWKNLTFIKLASILFSIHTAQVVSDEWTEPTTLSNPYQDAGLTQFAIDTNGNAVAVWLRIGEGNGIVQAAIKFPGGEWSLPVDISDINLNAREPKVQIDSFQKVVVIWRSVDETSTIRYTSALFGDAWAPAIALSAQEINSYDPKLHIGRAGDIVMASWMIDAGTYTAIQTSTFSPTTTFSTGE